MWVSVLEKFFPKKSWKKHYRKIIFYVLTVDNGLKPSFLWDFGPSVPSSVLSAFLKALKKSKLITLKISLVILKEDFFIANPNLVLQMLNGERLYVNVSDSLPKPISFERNERITKMIKFLKSELNNFENDEWKLDVGENFCVPTLFGLLLNYPVIYFYEDDYPSSSVKLRIFKVFCKFNFQNATERMEIYSFSFPQSLFDSHVDFCVASWFDRLPNVDQNFFSDLSIAKSVEDVNYFLL